MCGLQALYYTCSIRGVSTVSPPLCNSPRVADFPFNGKTVDVLYQRIKAAVPKYPEHFSPELTGMFYDAYAPLTRLNRPTQEDFGCRSRKTH